MVSKRETLSFVLYKFHNCSFVHYNYDTLSFEQVKILAKFSMQIAQCLSPTIRNVYIFKRVGKKY